MATITATLLLYCLSFALSIRPIESNVCTSAGCVRAAVNFLDSVDFSKNPCDDFFKFACGQWIKRQVIPDDETEIDSFSIGRDSVNKDMLALFEANGEKYNSTAIRITKQIFRKCMDKKALASIRSKPIHSFIRRIGGWPLLDKRWQEKKVDLTDLLSLTKSQFGIDPFFTSYVSTDMKNVSKHVLIVDQAILGLGSGTRDIYLNETMYEKQLSAYKDNIFGIARLIGTDMQNSFVDYDHLRKSIDKMIRFETRLANITVPEENRRSFKRLYNRWTLRKLGKTSKWLNWTEYMRRILPGEVYARLVKDQADTFPLIAYEPEYFLELDKLLTETSVREILNYVIWHVVGYANKFFDERFEDANQMFDAVFSGRQQKLPRWKTCIGFAGIMGMAYGAMYVREHFSLQDRNTALSMIHDIKNAFSGILDRLDWMDVSTRNFALKKVRYVSDKVAFPDFVLNDTSLDSFYKNLTWSEKDSSMSFFDLALKVNQWYRNKHYFDLLNNVDRKRFQFSPAVVNAFYTFDENSITLPAGILRSPLFDGAFPKYINYGAIGAVLGHELTHGFDDQGSQFDNLGYLKNWWSSSAANKFKNKKQCMINQYSDYVVPHINMHVNGRLTLGENIADNGGLKQSYIAYREYVKRSGPEQPLPALNMTNEQAFFVSFSQFWCGKSKSESSILKVLTDVHSPYIFRVNGAVSNMPEFSQVFKCPECSKMNPRKKCAVW